MQIKTTIVSCHTADSKPLKQEVNGTVILFPLVFPGQTFQLFGLFRQRRRKHRFMALTPGLVEVVVDVEVFLESALHDEVGCGVEART